MSNDRGDTMGISFAYGLCVYDCKPHGNNQLDDDIERCAAHVERHSAGPNREQSLCV